MADSSRKARRLMAMGSWGAELFDDVDRWREAEIGRRLDGLDSDQLRHRSIAAEVLDIRGLWSDAARAVREGPDVARLIRRRGRGDTALLAEQIRFVANYARVDLYRKGEYVAATRELLVCLGRLDDLRPRRPGIEAAVQFFLGCTLRLAGDFVSAELRYGLALDALRRRAASAEHEEEVAGIRRRTAVVEGLGLGWLSYNRGRLEQALQFITAAELMLAAPHGSTADVFHGNYLRLLRGSVLRAQGKYEAARSLLRNAQAGLTALRHPYVDRARLQLALCAIATGDRKEAEKVIAAMGKAGPGDARVHILRSRLHRLPDKGKPSSRAGREASLREANVAVAALQGRPFAHLEALLCKAEALGSLERWSEVLAALDDAGQVVALKERNQKLAGVIELNRAKALFHLDRFSRADESLERWRHLSHQVEHAFVHRLAAELEDLREQKALGFRIPLDGDLDARKQIAALRKWLVKRARDREATTGVSATQLLGKVSRATMFNWSQQR